MFVPAVLLLYSATHQTANGFVAVPLHRHHSGAFPIRPALALSSTAASDTNHVWVKLFIDKGDEDLDAFVIDPAPQDVSRLKEIVHQKIQPELSHCSATSLKVFPPGTNPVDIDIRQAYRPGKPCSQLPATTDEAPLIVAAKSRQNMGPVQNGELDYCFSSILIYIFL